MPQPVAAPENAVLTNGERSRLERFQDRLQSLPPSVSAFFEALPDLSYEILDVTRGYLYYPATIPGAEANRELSWNRDDEPQVMPDRNNLFQLIQNIRRDKSHQIDLTLYALDKDNGGDPWMLLPLLIGSSLRGIVCLPLAKNGFSLHFYSQLHLLWNELLEKVALDEIAYQYSEQEQRYTEAEQHVEVQERERRRIAAELHDELGQSLTALQLQLSMLTTADRNAEQVERLGQQAREQIVEMLNWVRSLTRTLNPTALSKYKLVMALELMLTQFRVGTTINITSDLDAIRDRCIPLPFSLGIYRIVQEATTNAVRYAGATNISVLIKLWGDSELRIEIKDDGCGFKPTLKTRGNGLNNIRERALALHGTASIHSVPGAGTVITAILPLPQVVATTGEQNRHRYALRTRNRKSKMRPSRQ